MMLDVLEFKLTTGDHFLAKFVNEDKENNYITLHFPMELFSPGEGLDTSVMLRKYLPFTIDQYLTLDKNNIVFAKIINEEFTRYYYNSIEYQTTYIEPGTYENMREANEALEKVTSRANKEFVETARKLKVDLSDLNNGPIH